MKIGLDKHKLGLNNIKEIVRNKDSICPQGWLVIIIADIDNSTLLKHLTSNGFKKDFKNTSQRWRYFSLDEDKNIRQLSSWDYIDLQEHITLSDANLILASDLLETNSKVTENEIRTMVSILPDQDIEKILLKVK